MIDWIISNFKVSRPDVMIVYSRVSGGLLVKGRAKGTWRCKKLRDHELNDQSLLTYHLEQLIGQLDKANSK